VTTIAVSSPGETTPSALSRDAIALANENSSATRQKRRESVEIGTKTSCAAGLPRQAIPWNERAWTIRDTAGDHPSPPVGARTDLAPCDVAIELHTSGAIESTREQDGIVPKLSDQG
jgi:hypothetical protein